MKIRRIILSGALLLTLVAATGCAYMHTQFPLSTTFNNTELGTKTGRASTYSVLWLVTWGDASTKSAATNGGIEFVECEDIETQVILFGLYTRVTTVAYGK
jgi:hypothetical protein